MKQHVQCDDIFMKNIWLKMERSKMKYHYYWAVELELIFLVHLYLKHFNLMSMWYLYENDYKYLFHEFY